MSRREIIFSTRLFACPEHDWWPQRLSGRSKAAEIVGAPEYPGLEPRRDRTELWKSQQIQDDRDLDENNQAGIILAVLRRRRKTERSEGRPTVRFAVAFQVFNRLQVSKKWKKKVTFQSLKLLKSSVWVFYFI